MEKTLWLIKSLNLEESIVNNTNISTANLASSTDGQASICFCTRADRVHQRPSVPLQLSDLTVEVKL